MRARSAIFPVVSFSTNLVFVFLLGGIFLNMVGLIYVAIVLYAAAVVFQFVTLPVEFNASRRAGYSCRSWVSPRSPRATGARKVLTAAAMTYVAAALPPSPAALLRDARAPLRPRGSCRAGARGAAGEKGGGAG
jgi:uncharacterized protein